MPRKKRGFVFDTSNNPTFFIEFIHGVYGAARDNGIPCRIGSWEKSHKSKDANDWTWVTTWRGSMHMGKRPLPEQYIIMQTEPLGVLAVTNKDRYSSIVKFANGAFQIWEYNAHKNAKYYTPGKRIHTLPIGYHPAWVKPPVVSRQTRSFDVFMFGNLSERRKTVIERIRQELSKDKPLMASVSRQERVYFNIVRNPERDALAVRAKMVLSVLATSNHLEHNQDSFRILPLLSLGCFVVAEHADHPIYKMLSEQGMVTCAYDEFPAVCRKWASNDMDDERVKIKTRLRNFVLKTFSMTKMLSTISRPGHFRK